ncbi:MAG: T9SS type A sorting domain-containing protein [Ignavibacteria bacterium]
MRKIYSLVLAVLIFMTASFSYAQKTDHSFGKAPESMNMPSSIINDNLLNANNRGFVYISGTNSHQWNKQVMGSVAVTPIGSPFTTPGWIGATARTSTGIIYVCNQASPFQIWSLDTLTGAQTLVTSVTGVPFASLTGIVWDHTTNTMYGVASDLTSSQILTINLTTGVGTPIGTASTVCGGAIGIYCAPNGTLFTNDLVNDNLVKWDKTTGAPTVVGPLNYAANYGQDGAFDLSDGTLYLASAGPGNILRICDTTTGDASTIIGTYSGQPSCLSIVADAGPIIVHTPLPNTQNVAGPYLVNANITAQGSTISSAKVFWSRNNVLLTDSIAMTNSGSNYSASIPGNGTNSTYRYQIRALQTDGKTGSTGVNMFIASSTDTTKPVITHTTLNDVPKTVWPATVNAQVTDLFGIDSVWVRWYKNNTGTGVKHFKLTNTSGDDYSAAFNSVNSDVMPGDSIFYKMFAKDASNQHNTDSTTLRSFAIIAQATACIGTGTTSTSYPFYTLYEDSRTQMLYTAAEITAAGGGAGFINKLGFTILTVGSPAMSSFSVKMQTITETTISTWTTTGWTEVFTSTGYTPPGTGLQYIDLATPYFWNGTGSLLIEVCFDNDTWSGNSTVAGTTQTGTVVHNHVDNSAGCNLTATSTAATRPNVCLIINTGVGVNPVGSTVPQVYSLSQNYPNPFNPSTKINFAIPKQGLVTMKIYDVLGREVRTLVNEVKSAGTYTVDFNASEFSSGVYFYRLQSEGFTDIKKMMLIK